MVKSCYFIKYYSQKMFNKKIKDSFWEKLIVLYYKLFRQRKTGINKKANRKRDVIVSMTSIPTRIDKVWITIESLLRQKYKPDRIILWLASDEFKELRLSDELRDQRRRGLEIRYCDNLKSYKKIYFTAKENPNSFIVTVDDDIIYAENMLSDLMRTYKNNKGCIICHRSHRINMRNRQLRSYNKWTDYSVRKDLNKEPAYYNFFTGCGGTLFPIFLMDKEVLNREAFMRLAPSADDVWLNFCAWISGIKIKNTTGILGHVIPIENSSNKGLYRINIEQRKNDEQIKQVLKYFKIDVNEYLK